MKNYPTCKELNLLLQESRRIHEAERLDLIAKSHSWNARTIHFYNGINVTSSVVPSSYHYPVTSMFHEGSVNVNSKFISLSSEGMLEFYFPNVLYVEYLRIYPYCSR